ncbi:MAG: molybdopterin cofactor-binding domain-containing protein, partial [Chloroflexota bacterium]
MSDENTTTQRRWKLSRRQFLIGLGATLTVGIASAPILTREARLAVNQYFQTGGLPTPDGPASPFVWFEITPDNHTTIYVPKVEMGQGIHTTLAQIAADELELDWSTITVEQANLSQGFDEQMIFTFGSTSTMSLFKPMRQIGATMRVMLRDAAAEQLNASAEQIVLENSQVYLRENPENRLSYGEVIAAYQGDWVIPEDEPVLKSRDKWNMIGRTMNRVDFQEKITGRAVYGYDARMDGMAYGAVARPPRYGASLVRAEAGTASDMPGVIAVVIEDGFAGIVAQTRQQARNALSNLVLEWDGGSTMTQDELEAYMRVPEDATGAILVQREGGGAQPDGRVIQADYWTPMAAHAHLEPQAALVSVEGERVIAYISTQHPGIPRGDIASLLDIPPENIDIRVTYLGAGFGRKLGQDVGVEAARLSRSAGVPVHVGWSREEDLQYGFHRPPSHNMLTAILDSNDRILALEHEFAGGDVFFGNGLLPNFVGNILGNDPMTAFGANIYYNFDHRRVFAYRRPLDIPTGYWRSLGSFHNLFALETFLDEVAHEIEVDPLTLRMDYLPEGDLGERFRVALETVTDASNWGNAPTGSAQGLAVCYDRGTVGALVIQVSGDLENLSIDQAWCAVDPGLVVNPDGAAAQIQGQIVMGLSSAMYEELVLGDGLVSTQNFHMYPLLTM